MSDTQPAASGRGQSLRNEIMSALSGPHEITYEDGYPDHFTLSPERAQYLAGRIMEALTRSTPDPEPPEDTTPSEDTTQGR